MKIASVLRFVLTLCAAATLSLAADVTGKWKTSFATPDGQTREGTMTLKAEGEKLTGTVSGRQSDTAISEGKISGDDISFVVVRSFQGNEVKLSYKGKVAGNEIKFTVDFGGQGNFEMTAKKEQ